MSLTDSSLILLLRDCLRDIACTDREEQTNVLLTVLVTEHLLCVHRWAECFTGIISFTLGDRCITDTF